MAEDAGRTRGRRAATPEPETEDTKRVVLKRERVLLLPEGITPETESALFKVMKDAKLTASIANEAWTVVGEFEGKSKNQAIEAHAGKPNTPQAKPGAYKAPTVSAFAGGRIYERPPEPKVEARDLD